MENIVSARRLRKSMLKDISYNNLNEFDRINIISKSNSIRRGIKDKTLSERKKITFGFKSRVLIKIFFSTLIIFTTLVCKLTMKDTILNNNKLNTVVNEYKNDWSKEFVTEKLEYLISKTYQNIKYIIPNNVKDTVSTIYFNNIKPKYMNFTLIQTFKKMFVNETIVPEVVEQIESNSEIVEKEIEVIETNGVGGAEPVSEEKYEESISAISSMNQDVEAIKAKNISMISPTQGVITSIYGARDEIFEGVNSYHTGTDIANVKGTEIKSMTTGKVISAVYNNKYYGNYVEVETDGVIFKYAHMDSINVTKGSKVNQGDLIGLMGSTGMSTGPHLHLEIKIDSRTVDPQELINL